MERYARAIGEGLAQQPEPGAMQVGPEASTAAGPESSPMSIAAWSVTPNGEIEPVQEPVQQIERLNREKEEAIANGDFERAVALRNQVDKLKKRNVALTTLIGQTNGHVGGDERDGVVILEASNDIPYRPAQRTGTDDEIVFIE